MITGGIFIRCHIDKEKPTCPDCARRIRRRKVRQRKQRGELGGRQTTVTWGGSPREQLKHWRNAHASPKKSSQTGDKGNGDFSSETGSSREVSL